MNGFAITEGSRRAERVARRVFKHGRHRAGGRVSGEKVIRRGNVSAALTGSEVRGTAICEPFTDGHVPQGRPLPLTVVMVYRP